MRQRAGPQSWHGAVPGSRGRKGQVHRDMVRHRPQHGTQFRSPTASSSEWLFLTSPLRSCPIFSQALRRVRKKAEEAKKATKSQGQVQEEGAGHSRAPTREVHGQQCHSHSSRPCSYPRWLRHRGHWRTPCFAVPSITTAPILFAHALRHRLLLPFYLPAEGVHFVYTSSQYVTSVLPRGCGDVVNFERSRFRLVA